MLGQGVEDNKSERRLSVLMFRKTEHHPSDIILSGECFDVISACEVVIHLLALAGVIPVKYDQHR